MLRPKMILDGRFQVEALVAVGGQAAVYRGWELSDHRPVALKLMRDVDGVEPAEARRQFVREWEVVREPARHLPRGLALIDHEGRPLIVEEWLDGHSLADDGCRLPLERAGHVALALLEALEDLHARDPAVVVRDIKPQNTLVDGDRVWLVDLSAAREDRGFRDTVQLGTPGFAAPEQYQGRSGPRSDLFSVGVMLHYLLTGQDAMGLSLPCSPGTVRPDVSSAVDAVVQRATQLDPERRYPSARQMAAELRRALRAPHAAGPRPRLGVASAPPVAGSRRAAAPTPSLRRLRGVLVVALAVMLVNGLMFGERPRLPPPPSSTATPSAVQHPHPLPTGFVPTRPIPSPRQGWSAGITPIIGFEASSVHEPHLVEAPRGAVPRWLPVPADWARSGVILRLVPGRLVLLRRSPPTMGIWSTTDGRRLTLRRLPGRNLLCAVDRPSTPQSSMLAISTDLVLQGINPADAGVLGTHTYAAGEALVAMLPASDRGWQMAGREAGIAPNSPLVGGVSRDRQWRVFDQSVRLIYRSAAVAPDLPIADGLTGSGHRIVMSSPSGTWCWRVDDATWIPFQPGEPYAKVAHDHAGRMLVYSGRFVATRNWQGYVSGWSVGRHARVTAATDRAVPGAERQYVLADGGMLTGYNLQRGSLIQAFTRRVDGRVAGLWAAPWPFNGMDLAVAMVVRDRSAILAAVDGKGGTVWSRGAAVPARAGPCLDAEMNVSDAALLYRGGVLVLGGPGAWGFAAW